VAVPFAVPLTVTQQVPLAERLHVGDENETFPVPETFVQAIGSPLTEPKYPFRVAVQVHLSFDVNTHESERVVVALLTVSL